MKNFPLLSINNENWIYTWHECYVLYLANQVKGLYNYRYFMIPPFRRILFSETPISGYEEIENLIVDNKLYYNKMPVHSCLQLLEETALYNNEDFVLPSGTWVVSNARNEGNNDLVNDFNYYSYFPGGFGSFYVPTDIIALNDDNNKYMTIWTFLENAGEVFGYHPGFNAIFATNRFVIRKNNIPNRQELNNTGLDIYSYELGTYISQNSQWIFQQWFTLGTPMHFFFTSNNEYGEEIILEERHKINLMFGNTHAYQILSSQKDIESFYVDFI